MKKYDNFHTHLLVLSRASDEDMAKMLVQNILNIYIPEFQKMDKAVVEISDTNK